jgi:hypothetical protein
MKRAIPYKKRAKCADPWFIQTRFECVFFKSAKKESVVLS